VNIGQPEIVDTTAALQLFLDALPSRNDAQRNFYVGLEQSPSQATQAIQRRYIVLYCLFSWRSHIVLQYKASMLC